MSSRYAYLIALSIFKGRQCGVNIFVYKGWTILFLRGMGVVPFFLSMNFFFFLKAVQEFFRHCPILSFSLAFFSLIYLVDVTAIISK